MRAATHDAAWEAALYDAKMPPELAPPDLSLTTAHLGYAVPNNVRLVSGVFKAPLLATKRIEYASGKGEITKPMVRTGHESSNPWAETGEPRLEYEPYIESYSMKRESWRYAARWGRGRCLAKFVALATVPTERFPERVLRFAQQWGVLRICLHRKPERHRRASGEVDPPCRSFPSYGLAIPPTVFSEPMEAWERYSRQLRALLCVAANLTTGKPGRAEDWFAIEQGEPPSLPPDEREHWGLGDIKQFSGNVRLNQERIVVSDLLRYWLAYGNVKPLTYWNKTQNRWEARLGYDGLIGRLALELCAILSHGVYRCAGCRVPFGFEWEERKRPRNRNFWCGRKECLQEKNRQAQRRRYYKLRENQ